MSNSTREINMLLFSKTSQVLHNKDCLQVSESSAPSNVRQQPEATLNVHALYLFDTFDFMDLFIYEKNSLFSVLSN